MKTRLYCGAALAGALLASVGTHDAEGQVAPYIGQIKTFGFDYCPRGWIAANGQELLIVDYSVLYSLYGNIYGGSGHTTFAVPNLNDRFAMGRGQGPGLYPWFLGEMYGQAEHHLTVNQMPAHNHSFNATTTHATEVNPTGRTVGSFVSAAAYAVAGTSTVPMNSASIGATGGSDPITIQDPYLALNFCVNLDGVYPPRN